MGPDQIVVWCEHLATWIVSSVGAGVDALFFSNDIGWFEVLL